LIGEDTSSSTGHLRKEENLDTSPPVSFEGLPLETVRSGHDSAAGSGVVFAKNFVTPQAGPVTPDELFEPVLLTLQRTDT